MKIIVRGWGDGRLLFEDPLETDGMDMSIAYRQVERVTAFPRNMLEIEFVEEPDPLQKFFRFGTDKDIMVNPLEIDRGRN